MKKLRCFFMVGTVLCILSDLQAQLFTYPMAAVNAAAYIMPASCQIENTSYVGSPGAIARFNGFSANFGLYDGIIMTTGVTNTNLTGPLGPNNLAGASTTLGLPGLPPPIKQWLGAAIGTDNFFDASVLKIKFKSTDSTLIFKYVFASEEYNEYVDTDHSDAFAMYIEGPGIPGGYPNMALVPNTSLPITINTINGGYSTTCTYGGGTNEQYFVDNCFGYHMQYDGYTTPLIAYSNIIPNETYMLNIVITDVGDGQWDSGVFIGSGGITANTPDNIQTNSNIYPNPSNGSFTVTGLEGETNLYLSNFSGQIVWSATTHQKGDLDVVLEDVPAGVYFLTRQSGYSNSTDKILVFR